MEGGVAEPTAEVDRRRGRQTLRRRRRVTDRACDGARVINSAVLVDLLEVRRATAQYELRGRGQPVLARDDGVVLASERPEPGLAGAGDDHGDAVDGCEVT